MVVLFQANFNKNYLFEKWEAFKQDPMVWTVIIGITLFFLFFLVLPLSYMLISIVFVQGLFDLSAFGTIFSDPFFWDPWLTRDADAYFLLIERPAGFSYTIVKIRGPNFGVFLNTIVIGLGTTCLSLIFGLTTAFILARVDFRGKTIINGLLLIPLILPPFVGGIGFQALFGTVGLLNKYVLQPTIGINLILEGIVAIVFVQSLHYFTLIHLNIYSALINSDPSLEEAAENLGASKWKITRSVTLPLAYPGIAAGSILVLILSMEDLGTPIIFANSGDLVAKQTITYYISKNIFLSAETSSEINQISAILGGFLLLFALIGFYAIRKFVSLKQYSIISKGRSGDFRMLKPSVFWKTVIYLFFIGLFFISTIPHWGVLLISVLNPGFNPEFTLDHYGNLFDPTNGFALFIQNTLFYSVSATLFILVLATLAGYVANRKEFFGKSFFDMLVTIPIAIPGIVLGIGFISLFAGTGSLELFGNEITLNPFISPILILIISFTIRKFPFTVRAVYAGLQQVDEALEESAINLGATKKRTLFQIVIPLIAFNIIGGALVSLVYNMSEVSTSLVLINSSNFGNLTWKLADETGKLSELATIGVLLMVIQVASLLVTNILLKNRTEAIAGI